MAWAMPSTPFKGVRISWLMAARTSVLAWLATSASFALGRDQRRLCQLARGDVLHRADQSAYRAVGAADALQHLGDPELFAAPCRAARGTQRSYSAPSLWKAARGRGDPLAVARGR